MYRYILRSYDKKAEFISEYKYETEGEALVAGSDHIEAWEKINDTFALLSIEKN